MLISTMNTLPELPSDSRNDPYPQERSREPLWDAYVKARESFWSPQEISLARDTDDYRLLGPGERRLVEHILAFFAFADRLVNVNLAQRFMNEVPYKEAKFFYALQMAIEDIHATAYIDMLKALISDVTTRERLIDSVSQISVIERMGQYMRACAESDAPLQERILRMACVEGIFFSGAFCVIYWLQGRGLMPGLGQANEFIARDEGLHTTFALLLFNMFTDSMPESRIHQIVDEAVSIGVEFISDALPEGVNGMNKDLMSQYIKFVADIVLEDIHCGRMYNVANPFGFMEQINMRQRTNFFERGETQYTRVTRDVTTSRFDQAF